MRSQINITSADPALVEEREQSQEWTYQFVEETLIVDERAAQRPAQAVEDKLSRVLANSSIGANDQRLKGLIASRSEAK